MGQRGSFEMMKFANGCGSKPGYLLDLPERGQATGFDPSPHQVPLEILWTDWLTKVL